jgi:uncharacterized protein
MRDAFPNSVEPRRLAELGRELSGHLSLERMPRLAEVVFAAEGQGAEGCAAFKLSFEHDANKRHLVRGEVRAKLKLRCERCNEPFEFPVSSNFTLAVISGFDEAAQLPDDYEPLLLEEAAVDPATLVEDELLLSVPAVPRHPTGACEPPRLPQQADATAGDRPQRDNPFAVLETLKRHH